MSQGDDEEAPASQPLLADGMTRFYLEELGIRGVIVHLDQAWRQIKSHADYPPAVAAVLGECLAAAALFAGDIKLAGSISVQLKATAALKLAFAECTAQGHVRGIARWDEPLPEALAPSALGPEALLAITIERDAPAQRYQGMVPLIGTDFAEAFEAYFAQSEQLPTTLKLCSTPTRCAGLLLQQVPPEGGEPVREPSHAFERVRAAADALRAEDLLHQAPEQILIETFPELAVRVFAGIPLEFRCRCSRERVAAVLKSLGRGEAQAALDDSAVVEVTCEFCGRSYTFDGVDVAQIYGDNVVEGPATRH